MRRRGRIIPMMGIAEGDPDEGTEYVYRPGGDVEYLEVAVAVPPEGTVDEGQKRDPPVATAEQYAICKSIYDLEKERYGAIWSKANIYITLSSVLLGGLLFKYSELAAGLHRLHVKAVWELVVVLMLLAALGSALISLLVRSYQPIQTLPFMVEELEAGITNEEFYATRIGDMSVSESINSPITDRAANAVQWCQLFMFGAVIVQAIIVASGFVLTLEYR